MGGKKDKSPVAVYKLLLLSVCGRAEVSPVSTCHRRPADLLQNIVKGWEIAAPLVVLASFTLVKGRINAQRHRITVPMLAAVD